MTSFVASPHEVYALRELVHNMLCAGASAAWPWTTRDLARGGICILHDGLAIMSSRAEDHVMVKPFEGSEEGLNIFI